MIYSHDVGEEECWIRRRSFNGGGNAMQCDALVDGNTIDFVGVVLLCCYHDLFGSCGGYSGSARSAVLVVGGVSTMVVANGASVDDGIARSCVIQRSQP